MEKNFEEKLKELEKIVEELEKSDLPLDVTLKKYEEGVKLGKELTKLLETAKEVVIKEIK